MTSSTGRRPGGRIGSTPAIPGDHFLTLRRPSPALGGIVDRFAGYCETGARHFRQHEAASLVLPLVLSFGEPFRIALGRPPADNERFASFATGLFGGHVVIEFHGGCHCLQVDFTPQGARRFFAMPMHELAHRVVLLDDLPCPKLAALRERLGEEPDWQRRFDLVERFILARVARVDPGSGDVASAYHSIVASGGTVRITALADEIGCSRKHLAARFKAEVGLAPKEVRAHRALQPDARVGAAAPGTRLG